MAKKISVLGLFFLFILFGLYLSLVQAQATTSKVFNFNSSSVTSRDVDGNPQFVVYEQAVTLTGTSSYTVSASAIPYRIRDRGIKVVLYCNQASCTDGKVQNDRYTPEINFDTESTAVVNKSVTIANVPAGNYKVAIFVEDASEASFSLVSLKKQGETAELLLNSDFQNEITINSTRSQPKSWKVAGDNWSLSHGQVLSNFDGKTVLLINSNSQETAARYEQGPFTIGGDYTIEASARLLAKKGRGVTIILYCIKTDGCPGGKNFNDHIGSVELANESINFQTYRSQTIHLAQDGEYGLKVLVQDGSEILFDSLKLFRDTTVVNANSDFAEAENKSITELEPQSWTAGTDNWGYAYGSVIANCQVRSEGDADCNGIVNDADYDIWECRFLNGPTCATASFIHSADFNGDDKTDMMDFEIWRSSKFSGRYDTGPATNTPSPTSTTSGNCKPVITTPADDSVVPEGSIEYTWNRCPDVIHYYFRVQGAGVDEKRLATEDVSSTVTRFLELTNPPLVVGNAYTVVVGMCEDSFCNTEIGTRSDTVTFYYGQRPDTSQQSDLVYYEDILACVEQTGPTTVVARYEFLVRNMGEVASPANRVELLFSNSLGVDDSTSNPIPPIPVFGQTRIIGSKEVDCPFCDPDLGIDIDPAIAYAVTLDRDGIVAESNEIDNFQTLIARVCDGIDDPSNATPTNTPTPTPSPTTAPLCFATHENPLDLHSVANIITFRWSSCASDPLVTNYRFYIINSSDTEMHSSLTADETVTFKTMDMTSWPAGEYRWGIWTCTEPTCNTNYRDIGMIRFNLTH